MGISRHEPSFWTSISELCCVKWWRGHRGEYSVFLFFFFLPLFLSLQSILTTFRSLLLEYTLNVSLSPKLFRHLLQLTSPLFMGQPSKVCRWIVCAFFSLCPSAPCPHCFLLAQIKLLFIRIFTWPMLISPAPPGWLLFIHLSSVWAKPTLKTVNDLVVPSWGPDTPATSFKNILSSPFTHTRV